MSTRHSGVATDIYFTQNHLADTWSIKFLLKTGNIIFKASVWVKLYSDCDLLNKRGVDASFKINMKKSGFATELYLDQKDILDM